MNTPKPTAKRPTKPAQSAPLKSYLAGAIGTAALLGATQTEAAVTAVTFGFGSVLDSADAPGVTSVGGFGTLREQVVTGNFRFGANPSYYGTWQGGIYQTASYNAFSGLASFFANGTIIGAGGNGTLGQSFFENTSRVSLDLTSDQLSKNIGFQTSSGNWGWANVSWTESSKTLAINSAYVESVAGNTITVGDVGAVPEPSRALLALAGLGCVALRRRRKQAAY